MARKKQKKHRRPLIVFLGTFAVIAALALLVYLAVVLFPVKQIVVTGNHYCSSQEVLDWVKKDKYAVNSLYIFCKYNLKSTKQLPAVESTQVKLLSPNKVQIAVKEKSFCGRIDYEGAFLYYDREGIVSLITTEVIEGVMYIEGMETEQEKIRLGEALPVTDSGVLEKLGEVQEILKEYKLSPDKISFAGSGLVLHFGGVRAQIGDSGFADKLAQVPPILEKMSELYGNQSGVLHLENYDVSDGSIRFKPDSGEQGQ